MKQKLLLLLATCFVLFFGSQLAAQQTIEGDYLIGETKAKIKIENDEFRVFWEDVTGSTRLRYDENMITGEQVWIETKGGKKVGNFILNNDYSEGKYVRLTDNQQFFVKKVK